jgi:hypothetical protein
MACSSGPNIVDDGLVAAYDAANTKSYRGSALINRYYTQTGNSANTNIWDKVGLSASSNVAIDSSRGTWNGNTIFKATVAASGSYLGYQSIRKCIAASHNTAIGTSRRLTFKVRMLEPSSTAISNISYHNGGGTAGHNSSHFTLLDESEVPADSIIKDNWYLLELDVSGTYSSGHCVGIGLPSAHSQAVTFLFTELMVYSSADSGSEPQPFTPTERSATDGFEDMISTNDGDLSGTYQHNDNKESIRFDGTNDYIRISESTSTAIHNIGSTASIECWFKSESGTTSTHFGILFGWGETGTAKYSNLSIGNWFSGASDESIHLGYNAASVLYYEADGSTKYHDGNWHHVIATIGPNQHKIYVDGVSKSMSFQTGTNGYSVSNVFGLSSGSVVEIGRRPYNGGSGYFNGRISNARIYNKVLTAAEVAQNFNALRGRFGI